MIKKEMENYVNTNDLNGLLFLFIINWIIVSELNTLFPVFSQDDENRGDTPCVPRRPTADTVVILHLGVGSIGTEDLLEYDPSSEHVCGLGGGPEGEGRQGLLRAAVRGQPGGRESLPRLPQHLGGRPHQACITPTQFAFGFKYLHICPLVINVQK